MTFKIIDKSNEIEAIKHKFGERYYTSIEATQEAAELWGVQCNKHGVIQPTKEETLLSSGSCAAKITFAETRKGYFLIGLRADKRGSGFGYAPSVWSKTAFDSHWDAREFAIGKLIEFFEKECNPDSRKAIEKLRSELTPQLSFF